MKLAASFAAETRDAAHAGVPPQACAVVMRGVCKSFTRGRNVTEVLRGVALEVPRGSCTFLVGPSGCGKSTLLSILGCLLTPDSGDVWVLGQHLPSLTERQRQLLRMAQIGFVFQRFHLLRGLTALENVAAPMALAGIPPAAARQRARDLLHAVGLAEQAGHDIRRLSHGQCQRVALARALANDPALILADEPTAALDETSGRQVMDLLQSLLRQFGKTALVVTHDSRIFPFADHIWRMEHGRLFPMETPPCPPARQAFHPAAPPHGGAAADAATSWSAKTP